MAFPNELSVAIDNLTNSNYSFEDVNKDAKRISEKYRANDNGGTRLVKKNTEAVAYALARMPATYEAVSNIMNQIYECNSFEIKNVLDVGAGTAAATWAIYQKIGHKKFTCLERESEMISIGKKLMQGTEIEECTEWKKFDITKDEITDKSDVVITSYMINELAKNDIEDVTEKLLNATNNLLVIVEPGTPKGFTNIRNIRKILISKNCNIVAPCSHEQECKIPENDWCQFSCRVQRSKTQKILKGGVSPYEDEKFSYIVVSKHKANMVENRILRHPIINKGFSEYKVCTAEGIKNVKLSKKDGILYKEAKKKSAGDSLKLSID